MKITQIIKDNALPLRQDRVFIWSTRFSFLLFILCFGILFFYWQKLPPVIPLYYSLPWGEEQLGTPGNLLAVMSGIFGLYVLNLIGALFVYIRSAYYARILLVWGLFLVVLMGITLIQIIRIVS